MTRFVAGAGVISLLALAACGGGTSTPNPNPVGVSSTPTPAPTPSPTPVGVVLPTGMVCPNPTPPPMLGMKVTIQAQDGDKLRLDSKPQVPNTDNYCDKVGFGAYKFCDTRVEGTSDRVACDYLATGIADNGRWGPNWYYNDKPCGSDSSTCVLNPDNQYLAIGKVKGTYKACAADIVPVDPSGSRCGEITVQ